MAPPDDKSNNQKRDKKGKGTKVGGVVAWIIRYSGPIGVICLIGIYVALFGIASQRYENRIDIIENRANSVFDQLAVPSAQKKALSRIARVQNMSCPNKPRLLNPYSVFLSLFGSDSNYKEMVNQLKETVEDLKDSLDSVNLQGAYLVKANLFEANLKGANLEGANLQGAYLRRADLGGASLGGANLQGAYLRRADLGGADFMGADLEGADFFEADLRGADFMGASLGGANLRGAKTLSVSQICEATSLYETKLDPEFEKKIKEKCPNLLEPLK